jgi:hypothetical protein
VGIQRTSQGKPPDVLGVVSIGLSLKEEKERK